MGVMSCCRSGCGNIMCDRYSPKLGYICNECYRELCASAIDPEVFMESPKSDRGDLEDHQRRMENMFKWIGELE